MAKLSETIKRRIKRKMKMLRCEICSKCPCIRKWKKKSEQEEKKVSVADLAARLNAFVIIVNETKIYARKLNSNFLCFLFRKNHMPRRDVSA